jgi:glycosyltransferase involved in cell wall biosynthesis
VTKIIANMIGRNEESHYLSRVLARVVAQVDVITFTDDHSDDNTAQIAKDFGAEVFVMSEPTFSTHEGRLRQASWEHLERTIDASEPWYVLAIDCDEMLYEVGKSLRDIVEMSEYDVANINFFHMWNETQFRHDKAWAPHGSSRLFRYFAGGSFADRQLACGSEPTYVQSRIRSGRYLADSGLMMKHLSYIKDEDKKAKFDRYMKLDGGAFHANAHILSIMDENPVLKDFPWEGGGPE